MKRILPFMVAGCIYITGQAQNFAFTLTQTLAAQSDQRGLVCTDFNLDGKKDIIVGSAYSSGIYMFAGNSNGQFTANAPLSVVNGNSAIYLAPADYNNDGKQDIAFANYNADYVGVLTQTSPGNYSSATYSVGGYPYCVASADFNMDGSMDLVATSLSNNNVSVLLNNGSGSFSLSPGGPLAGSGSPYHVSAGSFNSDNFPDLAFISGTGNILHVYLGNGAGSFTQAPGSPYSTGQQPRTICVSDLNGDGFSDLAIPNASSNNISIFLGTSTGSFSAAAGSPVNLGSGYPYQAVAGDFDVNGAKDLIVTMGTANNLSVLSGNGTGGFSLVPNFSVNVGPDPQTICTGDFNGDGSDDLAVAGWGNNLVYILENVNAGCTLATGFTYSATNDQVTFTASSTGTVAGTSYSWNFGDSSTGSGASTSHTYAPGTYTVVLSAVNSTLCSSTATHIITITRSDVSIAELAAGAGVQIYPNPASGILNIDLSDASQRDLGFELYSVLGEKILSTGLLSPVNRVDISDLSNGVFIYQITQKNKVVKAGRIVLAD